MIETPKKPLTMVGSPDAVACAGDVCEVPESQDQLPTGSTTGVQAGAQAGAHPSPQA